MRRSFRPIRLLTAVPICDGHDSAINTINLELIRSGIEVIYLGYHRSARDIVRAAIQEDVRAIGISSYNGGHIEFFGEVLGLLRKQKAGDIALFGGGGGTISAEEGKAMVRRGVDRIFHAGTPLSEIVSYVRDHFSEAPSKTLRRGDNMSDRAIARWLSTLSTPTLPSPRGPGEGTRAPVIGFTGPGGAGKTTLIDEVVLRCLGRHPDWRIAILSHDPSVVGKGALLGDRATMIYCQDDRVFMRSLATRGTAGGLSAETKKSLRILKACPFNLILVETVGTGQEAVPFARGLVDKTVMVMSPEYGARLQLQKIAMLDLADVVVVNKSDLAGARTAINEIEQRLAANGRGQRLVSTVAKRHRDVGVDGLVELVLGQSLERT